MEVNRHLQRVPARPLLLDLGSLAAIVAFWFAVAELASLSAVAAAPVLGALASVPPTAYVALAAINVLVFGVLRLGQSDSRER